MMLLGTIPVSMTSRLGGPNDASRNDPEAIIMSGFGWTDDGSLAHEKKWRCKACHLKVLIHDTSCCWRIQRHFPFMSSLSHRGLVRCGRIEKDLFNYFILNKENTE
jgi:hypothetical protein